VNGERLKQGAFRASGRLAVARSALSIRGHGNIVTVGTARLSGVAFDVRGNDNRIQIADGCRLRGVRFFIRGDRNAVTLATGVTFRKGGVLWLEDGDCVLSIGEYTTVEDAHLAVTEPGSRIDIGARCMFATDVEVRTGDSHPIYDIATDMRINSAKSVVIGDDVWVAARATILKGVRVPAGTVIGTGAVVTKSPVRGHSIVAGSPAREVRAGVRWERER
jgi:acetyltransferase-like isoleucine patch superfamily enzyme